MNIIFYDFFLIHILSFYESSNIKISHSIHISNMLLSKMIFKYYIYNVCVSVCAMCIFT